MPCYDIKLTRLTLTFMLPFPFSLIRKIISSLSYASVSPLSFFWLKHILLSHPFLLLIQTYTSKSHCFPSGTKIYLYLISSLSFFWQKHIPQSHPFPPDKHIHLNLTAFLLAQTYTSTLYSCVYSCPLCVSRSAPCSVSLQCIKAGAVGFL